MRRKATVPQAILALLTLMAVGIVIMHSGRPALSVLEARNWRSVPCTITECELGKPHRQPIGHQDPLISFEKGGPPLRVSYAYAVAGQILEGHRWSFGANEDTRVIVSAYPPGTETTCWYAPDNPKRAVVDRRGQFLLHQAPGIGLFFIFLGVFWILSFLEPADD